MTNQNNSSSASTLISIIVTLTGFGADKGIPVDEEATFLYEKAVFKKAVIERTEQFVRYLFEFAGQVVKIDHLSQEGEYDHVTKIATMPLTIHMKTMVDSTKLAKGIKALEREGGDNSPLKKGRFVIGIDIASDSLPEPKGLEESSTGVWTLFTQVGRDAHREASAIYRMKLPNNPFYNASLDKRHSQTNGDELIKSPSKEAFTAPTCIPLVKEVKAERQEENQEVESVSTNA